MFIRCTGHRINMSMTDDIDSCQLIQRYDMYTEVKSNRINNSFKYDAMYINPLYIYSYSVFELY